MKGKRATGSSQPLDVTFNGQVIPSSSSVKFLGITFRSHFRTVATLARHRLLKLNSIFSSTYGPSTSTLNRLYNSYTRSLFDYGAPATCIASPDIQLSWERIQTHFISQALSIPSFIHNDRKRQHAYLPPIHDRNLYLAKRWYRRAMQHNRGVQDYIDNHTRDKRHIRSSRNTPLELIRNYFQIGKPQENVNIKLKQTNTTNHLLSDFRIPLFSSFYIRNSKNCKYKKYKQTVKK